MSEIASKHQDGTVRNYGPFDPVHCYPQANNHPFNPCNDKDYVSNTKFSKENAEFKKACSEASVPATPRQASKYRRKQGLVYKFAQQERILDVEKFKLHLCKGE